MNFDIVKVDYNNIKMFDQLAELLNDYACDPMGGGKAISPKVLERLAIELPKRNDAVSFIALNLDTEHSSSPKAVGLINAFEGFSTFQAKPLMNIHDVFVKKEARGSGVAQALMLSLEKEAIARRCCKLTLEVLNKNHAAKRTYEKLGYSGYELDPSVGQAVFWQKEIG